MGGDVVLAGSNPEAWALGTVTRAQRGTVAVDGGLVTGDAAAQRYTTLARSGGLIGVAVPTGFQLIITRIRVAASVAGSAFNLAHGTNDVGESSAVAPAGLLLLTPAIALAGSPYLTAVVNVVYEWEVYYTVAAGRFLCPLHEIGVGVTRCETLGVLIPA